MKQNVSKGPLKSVVVEHAALMFPWEHLRNFVILHNEKLHATGRTEVRIRDKRDKKKGCLVQVD